MSWSPLKLLGFRPATERVSVRAVSEVANEAMVRAPVVAMPPEEARRAIAAGLDDASLMFLEVLRNTDRNEDGSLVIGWDARIEAFRLVKDWLTARSRVNGKFAPAAPDEGIKAYQDFLKTGPARREIETAINKRGVKTRGRKTKAQKAREAAAAATVNGADSSALTERMAELGGA
ncbi:MAG: hypothetical protein KGL39_25170 [Patescibacteria group bacterium]|nr:hypothetical protein [Patescibacteria group bacterium]